MFRQLPLVVAIALVVGTGAVRARWAAKKADTRDLKAAAARLETIPLNVGDWVGTTRPFDLSEYEAAGIHGALLRNYKHKGTGQLITLLIVCGRPGPISAHTPDVCYAGAGYDEISNHIPVAVDGPPGPASEKFWKLRVAKKEAITPDNLDVTYGWSTDGRWQAPERDARFAFADARVLFKLYAVRPAAPPSATTGEATEAETDPTNEFLRALLPELNHALFAPPAAPAPAAVPSAA